MLLFFLLPKQNKTKYYIEISREKKNIQNPYKNILKLNKFSFERT